MRSAIIGRFVAVAMAISTAQAQPAEPAAPTKPITVVAAENFYGDIARQIGGDEVAVTSILTNPDQDPHEFEASPSTARAFADAAVVIINGAGYDGWANKLLAASPSSSRAVVIVAALVHKAAGDNPHVWYDPATMPALAEALAGLFIKLDPVHQVNYAHGLTRFQEVAQAPRAPNCRTAHKIFGKDGDRDGTGLRLYGGSPRSRNAQRRVPTGGHERY